VKLALELSKRDTGRTLYILDEPTTGLHFHDIEMLLTGAAPSARPRQHRRRHRAQSRRDQDRPDWIIDLGPEAARRRIDPRRGPARGVAKTAASLYRTLSQTRARCARRPRVLGGAAARSRHARRHRARVRGRKASGDLLG
jgi:excinuclease ABC subunit A